MDVLFYEICNIILKFLNVFLPSTSFSYQNKYHKEVKVGKEICQSLYIKGYVLIHISGLVQKGYRVAGYLMLCILVKW